MTKARASSSKPYLGPYVTRPSQMKPIGILGGGQLARMMALKAHEMGLKVSVLSEHQNDPAAQVADWVQGDLKSAKDLKNFLASCELATFESEFLDADLLADLARKTGTPILPEPAHMAKLQDRLSQKNLLIENRLPTAEFFAVATASEARKALAELGGKAVFKKRRFGYDGYGTFVIRGDAELERFLPELAKNPHGFIAESFVPFRREIAVMVVRSASGSAARYPFVETRQESSRCLWVKGPVKKSSALQRLGAKLERFLANTRYVGVMGVELFETRQGTYLINELAPRVHNSGHYTLDAMRLDQFSAHLQAILGLDVAAADLTPLAPAFAMWNLLGSSARAPSWRLPTDVRLHWYGKEENRPGRKMGHLNMLAGTPERALAQLKRRRADFDV